MGQNWQPLGMERTGHVDDGPSVPPEVLGTAFFAHSTELVAHMARVLGANDTASNYSTLARAIKPAFNRVFVQPDGTIQGDTQAGYALALHFNLLPEQLRPAAAEHMVRAVRTYNHHISTGIQSTVRLMLELTREGQNDIVWQLMTNRTMPSWGYSLEQGATTVWERWDGYVAGRGFQDPGMNSLNHYAIGAVHLPVKPTSLLENAQPAHQASGIRAVRSDVEGTSVEVGSGDYRFSARL